MKYTENLNLKKPDLTDYVNVSDLNDNSDVIDAVIAGLSVNTETYNAHMGNFVEHTRYGSASGVNAKNVTLSPVPTTYTEGMSVAFKNVTTNTGSVTLNLNSLGAKPLVRSDGTAIPPNILKANSIYTARYNGTSFILQGEGGEFKLVVGNTLLIPQFNGNFVTFHTVMSETAYRIIGTSGVYRLSFTIGAGTTGADVYGQWYKNGIPYGTKNFTNGTPTEFTEDLQFEAGDRASIYILSKRPAGDSANSIQFKTIVKVPYE
ncbi:hypothetical protein [Sporosarcina sp. FSL K6-5500]|uniref:hypothetical protein n=1 Tax=Sporosarcina sp. FSL K6-5500 TaxID=2921558 RepID=UPI0030F8F41B